VGDGLGPLELKRALERIEAALGRRRQTDRYAPRNIDLDLLVHGNLNETSDELKLPHPDLVHRPFVAAPLFELAPTLVLPGSGIGIEEAVNSLEPFPMEPLPGLTRQLRKELLHEGRDQP